MPTLRLGHYRIERRLGEGGMGIVFLAHDDRLARPVALKILQPGADASRKERFLREARAAAAVSHANLAAIHDVGETEVDEALLLGDRDSTGQLTRIAYLVFEYVPGEDLRERLEKGRLSIPEILAFAGQLAHGLDAAHRARFIHRDLKPANIRITPQGQLKILDFGLAKWDPQTALDERATESFATTEGVILGTAPYASPEQALGLAVDARSDLFSLGAVLYEMATGALPFDRSSRVAILRAIVHDEPRAVATLAPEIPASLAKLIHSLLEKDPANRPQSASAVATAIAELEVEHARRDSAQRDALAPTIDSASAVPVGLNPAMSARDWRGWIERHRWSVAAATAMVVLLGAAFLVLGVRSVPVEVSAGSSLQNLAILPFENLTGDRALDYFARGIAETLAIQLAEIPALSVTGPGAPGMETIPAAGSADGAPGDTREDVRALGRKLGVGAVLGGGLQEAAERIRLFVRLTDVDTGHVIWSETFTEARDDLYMLQSAIAAKAADAISVPITPVERRRLARDPTRSAQAFDRYLRARRFLADQNSVDAPRLAAELLNEALRLDPEFTFAHAAASEAALARFEFERTPELLARAEAEARSALELAPDSVETRIALARVLLRLGEAQRAIDELEKAPAGSRLDRVEIELANAWEATGDRARAETHFLRAIALRPSWWGNWNQIGDYRLRGGDRERARESFQRAAALAPPGVTIPLENLASLALLEGDTAGALAAYQKIPGPIRNDATANNLGTVHFFAGNLDEASRYFELAAKLAPEKPAYQRNLGDLLIRQNRPAEARQSFSAALALVDAQLSNMPQDTSLRLERVLYLARVGRCDETTPLVAELGREIPESAESTHDLAQPLALCGERKEALRLVARSLELGYPKEMLRQEDEFSRLASDREFVRLTGG